MVDQHHVSLLRLGAIGWNDWRKENPEVEPDLRNADLKGFDLYRANLRGADLESANLQGANLGAADLTKANLSYSHLSGANLQRAVLKKANLSHSVIGNPPVLRSDFWHIQRYPGDDLEGVIWASLEGDDSLHYSDYRRYDIPDEEFDGWRNHIGYR
jgi:hypothetical protein